MSSIVYGGIDFSYFCTAETVLLGAPACAVESLAVPGRAGETVLDGRLAPLPIRVRLFLSLEGRQTVADLADARCTLRGWLAKPEGATLALPDEPGLVWRDVVCTDAGEWDRLFEDGSCELGFTAFDPAAYGAARSVSGTAVVVGGTWRTWPRIEMTARAGSSVAAELAVPSRRVEVARPFSGGEQVVVDCEGRTVTVDGEDALADVTLESDLFYLPPGPCSMTFTGASAFTTYFTERWV